VPAGRTHDQVTWLTTPGVAIGTWLLTQTLDLTLLTAFSFLFAGLMFSGDLDVKSVQYKRWGWFRWIWIPYQKWVPHRSPLSHGPVLGTLARLVYLTCCLGGLIFLGTYVLQSLPQDLLFLQVLQPEALGAQTRHGFQVTLQILSQRPALLVAGLSGLWLGALSHTWADEGVSRWKKWRRRRASPRSKRNRAMKK